ncbi:hypothetical protein EYF80_019640 [Liparis tanakae]|uniref:Uncharacterized protein n=1 Tax=Liparis tanakae TaxID=230148 RepID=A0A4Z2HWC7_9TELE|nr:hypothetical protein EYF80_019640 [Liparis tanakae]
MTAEDVEVPLSKASTLNTPCQAAKVAGEMAQRCSFLKQGPTVSKRTLDLAIKEINYTLHRSSPERTKTAL